jgi:hypothetical protein
MTRGLKADQNVKTEFMNNRVAPIAPMTRGLKGGIG